MGELLIKLRENLKEKPTDETKLGFGVITTDHMLVMDYTAGIGWHDPRIVPYEDFSISPSAMSVHYGQTIFEGLKAYKGTGGEVKLFRPMDNLARLNRSARRLCMPELNAEKYMSYLDRLISIERDWIPQSEGASLYIRPFMFATEPYLGVRPSKTYKMMTILSPVGSYYGGGIAPTKIYVEDKYVRAVRGGIGEAKCGGNYAASLLAQVEAEEKGYTQVLWLDGVERKYIEEIGTSNAFFVIDGQVVTPELNGSILPGITRNSVIALLKQWGISVVERKLSIDELLAAYDEGRLDEVFAAGTAAVISPVGELSYKGKIITVNNGKVGELAQRIYTGIVDIQKGRAEDKLGWVYQLKNG